MGDQYVTSVAGVSFTNNRVLNVGGDSSTIYAIGVPFIIANSLFKNISSLGGAVVATNKQGSLVTLDFQISNTTFTDCVCTGTANGIAAAIYVDGNATITNCTFSRNYGQNVGALLLDVFSPLPSASQPNSLLASISDCTFDSNSALNGDGGALQISNYYTVISNVTFTNNTGRHGGGISILGSAPNASLFNSNSPLIASISITDCTLTGNSASLNGDGIYYASTIATEVSGGIKRALFMLSSLMVDFRSHPRILRGSYLRFRELDLGASNFSFRSQ